jgi:RNA polymerase sigma-70 factor (ECF subfamily)
LKGRFEAEAVSLQPRLYATALHLTRNPSDAEDLLQETYLRAYRGYSGFQPGTNLTAWMYRILRNTFVNGYRKRRLGAAVPCPSTAASQTFVRSVSAIAAKNPKSVSMFLDARKKARLILEVSAGDGVFLPRKS